MILVLATENQDKGKEIASMIHAGIDLTVRTLSDYSDFRLPPETGATYRENAILKAATVAKRFSEWALGDDSGLEIDPLNGAPGLYSARFAGENVSYADNRKKVLDLLGDLPGAKRSARFICTVAIANPDGVVEVVEGICEGRIACHEAGGSGFGYDPIFYLPEYGKTFAELSPSEKNQISHRGKALRAAMAFLQKRLGV